jgi:hypothetical protein
LETSEIQNSRNEGFGHRCYLTRSPKLHKRDWHEHLLLTDGTVENDGDDILRDENDPNVFVAADPSKKKKTRGRGGKSVMFQFVKPFLKLRTLGRRRRARNDQPKADDAYTPPIV